MNKHMFKLGLESLEDGEAVDVSALEKPEEGVEAHLVEIEGQDADLGEAEMAGDLIPVRVIPDALHDLFSQLVAVVVGHPAASRLTVEELADELVHAMAGEPGHGIDD